jgi:hypothetical protein
VVIKRQPLSSLRSNIHQTPLAFTSANVKQSLYRPVTGLEVSRPVTGLEVSRGLRLPDFETMGI